MDCWRAATRLAEAQQCLNHPHAAVVEGFGGTEGSLLRGIADVMLYDSKQDLVQSNFRMFGG